MLPTRKTSQFLVFTVFLLSTIACNISINPQEPTPTQTPKEENKSLNATEIAQTVLAGLTQSLTSTKTETPGPTVTGTVPTSTATATITPTFTITPTNTNTPRPCNQAVFISDVTIPDSTQIQINTPFTKKWRLQNTGSCTWTSGYHVIFDSGDRMNAPDAVAVTGGSIPYGSNVDVSVPLVAPGSAGTYRGNFRLRSPDGVVFGVGSGAAFYVQIEAVAPAEPPPPPAGQAELVITNITFTPYPPKKGQAVTVKVTSYNNGNAAAGPYTVYWWPGENYPAAVCGWNVPGMVAHGGEVHTCVYAGYPSTYGSINTKAVVDFNGQVAESNEGNNTFTKPITVVNP